MCTVVVVVTESKNIMSKTDRAESKLALGTVAPAGTGYEQAVTNTLWSAIASSNIWLLQYKTWYFRVNNVQVVKKQAGAGLHSCWEDSVRVCKSSVRWIRRRDVQLNLISKEIDTASRLFCTHSADLGKGYCTGQAIPTDIKKLFINRSWNWARTKSLLKGFKMHYRTSAILNGHTNEILNTKFSTKLWAFENRQFVCGIYGARLHRKIRRNSPAPTDLTENP